MNNEGLIFIAIFTIGFLVYVGMVHLYLVMRRVFRR